MSIPNTAKSRKVTPSIYKSRPFKAGFMDYAAGRWNGDAWPGLWRQFPAQMIYEFGRMHALVRAHGGDAHDVWPKAHGANP